MTFELKPEDIGYVIAKELRQSSIEQEDFASLVNPTAVVDDFMTKCSFGVICTVESAYDPDTKKLLNEMEQEFTSQYNFKHTFLQVD